MRIVHIWPKSKPGVELLQYGGRLSEFNGMSSQSHLPHCMVLPSGEFNVMIPQLRATLQGAATGRIHCHDSRATCHIAGCCHLTNSMKCHSCRATCHVAGYRPTATWWIYCHDPRATRHTVHHAMCTWRNQRHDRVTLHGVRILSAILKIVFRHILFFCFYNAVWALTSGGFRIVSDTLVCTEYPLVFIACQHAAARYWYSNSVCPSVCPWRSGIRWKRLNILS